MRRQGAEVIELDDSNEEPRLLVILGDEPDRAQVLRLDPETHRWRCSCFNATWHPSKRCRHLEAIAALDAPAHDQAG